MSPRVAIWDIETLPPAVWTWSLYKPVIGINQIIEDGRVAGVGWKWTDEKRVRWLSEFDLGHEEMVKQVHVLIEEADVLVGWNSISFDRRHMQAEFKQYGLKPPAPAQQIDLMVQAKKQFRLPSYKLDYVAQWLGVGAKMKHSGFDLWKQCIQGDPRAWATMGRYCRRDVAITDAVRLALLPYLQAAPHMAAMEGHEGCSNCGSRNLQSRGVSRTTLGVYPRFQCQGCGKWSRGAKTVERVDVRGIA